MRVALINVPFPSSNPASGPWITVPPLGYGGIQWLVATLAEAYLDLGLEVVLLGAPGSPQLGEGHIVEDVASLDQAREWFARGEFDMVHDHSNGSIFESGWTNLFLSTHSLTGRPRITRNVVFVSCAQREAARMPNAPVVRVPVNVQRHVFREVKEDYLLFLGRVSPWKGAYEAAQFAEASGLPLVLAGPTWDELYRETILRRFGSQVRFVGEVHGRERLDLLAGATAVLVLSQAVTGPWSAVWCEPGATVVSEAAASGTPVIASDNGCLPEIVPPVGVVIPQGRSVSKQDAQHALDRLPAPGAVRAAAEELWAPRRIGRQYLELLQRIREGNGWDAEA